MKGNDIDDKKTKHDPDFERNFMCLVQYFLCQELAHASMILMTSISHQ